MVTGIFESFPNGFATNLKTGEGQTDHIRKIKITSSKKGQFKLGNQRRSGNGNGNETLNKNFNKFIKFKNATINWLNGLPPIDYDSALYEFNADNEFDEDFDDANNNNINADKNENVMDRNNLNYTNNRNNRNNRNDDKNLNGLKGKLVNLKKLFKHKKAMNADPNDDNETISSSTTLNSPKELGKVQNLEETQYLEIRSNVREIFLPPDLIGQRKFLSTLTPKMRAKFAETHPWTVSNEIHTAKYTFFNFVPKNLFEQFRRVANVYFLILIILQGIPIFSNTNIFLAASPLVGILLVTAVKDAIEDWNRQKSDNLVNHSIVKVLERKVDVEINEQEQDQDEEINGSKVNKWFSFKGFVNKLCFKPETNSNNVNNQQSDNVSNGGWKESYWKDIRVGDIVSIGNNESIPADIVVISTSDHQGICYVETKNLDGETNLKIKQASPYTAWMRSAHEVEKLNAVLQVEPPSTKLYTFTGKMILPTETTTNPSSQGEESISDIMDAVAFPISPDNLILRGCQIRNTEFVIGVVAYTGPHSKIIMNSGKTPSKRSRIEKQMNPQIILSFVLLIVICLTCAIMQGQYVGGSISQAPYWYTVYKTGAMASPIFTGFLTFW